MQDRFQACEPERLVALLDLDADAPPATGSSFVADSDARTVLDPTDIPQIDGYDITGRLGEGGMGVVWRAVERGTRRAVALKVRPQFARGGSRARLRFEREVELAARLEHPHVARVYDSGVCRGLDYYGMELVDGQHLDRYVDDRKLKPREILALMRDVCLAVHYAHQRGVIHRDLKPSNILVTNDGQPHVVDFGLAKALAEESEDPALTQEGQYAGTPAFMSPEQAAGKSDRIDTRTDVWGLGATLYLLLTGHTPHVTKGPRYDVTRRVASEDVRRPRALNGALDAELEALLLKALAHDSDQRYDTAAELAQDIERYLNGQPLRAAPPSRVYRLRKYTVRHRLPLGIAAAFVLLLLSATVFSLRQARQTARERDQALVEKHRADEQAAVAQAVSQFQSDMLASADPARLLGDKVTVVDAIRAATKDLDAGKLSAQPLVEAAVRQTVGGTLLALGRHADAEPHLRAALELRRRHLPKDHVRTAQSLENLASLRFEQGRPADAEPLVREALEMHRRARPEQRFELAMHAGNLAAVLQAQHKLAEAEPLQREAVSTLRDGAPTEQLATALHNLADLYNAQGKVIEAEPVYREALKVARSVYPNGHPNLAQCLDRLAKWLRVQGHLDEAGTLAREALDLRRRLLPADHPDVAASLNELALLRHVQRKFAEAESLLRESLAMRRRTLAEDHPMVATTLNHLGELLLHDPGRRAEVEALLREALELRRRTARGNDPELAKNISDLGRVLFDGGDFPGAEAHLREALEMYRASLPDGHPSIAVSANNLARLLFDQDRFDDAAPLFREALESDRKSLPAGHPDLAHSIKGYAQIMYRQGNHAECEALTAEALEIFRRTTPKEDPSRVSCQILLAAAMQKQGKVEESLPLLAASMDPAVLAKLPPDLAAELNMNYGLGLARACRWEPAEAPLARAYERWTAPGVKPHPRTSEIVTALADLCDATGRADEAAQWRAKINELGPTTQPATRPALVPSSS